MTGAVGGAAATPGEEPLLQQRPFRMLTFSRLTSRIAFNALNFALVLLIVDETGKAFMSSLLVLALIVPATVVGIASGVVADAFPKRPIIFLADIARAAICLLIAFEDQSVALYFAAAIVLSGVAQFASSAEASVLPAIVARDRLARANAIGHAVTGIGQIGGFVILAPVALRVFESPEALFASAAVLFAIAAVQAVMIGRVVKPERLELGGEVRHPWWLAGLREIQRDAQVARATTEGILIDASLIIVGGLIPIYIQSTLGLPVEIGVLVLTPGAIGVIVGLRLAGYLSHRVSHAVLSSSGFVGFVAFLMVLTFVRPFSEFLGGYGVLAWLNSVDIGSFDGAGVIAMMTVIPLGFCYALVAVAAQTVINDRVPLHLQGRVLATKSALGALASSIPVLVAGAMTDLVGVTAVMATLALCVGAAAFANLKGPRKHMMRAVGVGQGQ
ncbi:MAG: MFS transporter [Dehalococcoidia bacterium]|nr:MFS transporter [Dehalococcoidia bacterium]